MENHIAYNKEEIKFKQVRDFGQLLLAPFAFFKQEFKKLSKALLFYASPFLIIGLTIIVFFVKSITDRASFDDKEFIISTFLYIGSFFLSLIISFSMANAVITSYVSLYADKGREGFSLEDVWNKAKKNFFKLFGQGFVVVLMIMIGLLFFYIPGIYLQIALSFVYIASVHEKIPFGKAVGRSFQIISGEWWSVFALNLVFGFLLSIVSYILIIPIYAVIFIGAATGFENIGIFISIGVFTVLYFFLYLFMYSVQSLLIDFQYFSIIEKKESPGLLQRVRKIRNEDEGNSDFVISPENEPDLLEKKQEKEKSHFDSFDYTENDNRFKPK